MRVNGHKTESEEKTVHNKQGRSQPFCTEGFLMYIACPIENRAPEALFTRGGGPGAWSPSKIFEFWVFRNGVSLILSTIFQ